MKYFTHPEGVFEIQIPFDWHYKNEVDGYENKSPFSFELFEGSFGCFQISCYHESEKPLNPTLPHHDFNTSNLEFAPSELSDSDFKVLLWGTVAGDYLFIAKYIYQCNDENPQKFQQELNKVKLSLATLMCLSPDRRELAIGFDRHEKFNASLAASFDVKRMAIENLSLVEFIIITGNQIDAYLRLSIVYKIQILENTNLFNLAYLFQGLNDKPIMEKKVYDKAKSMGIISAEQNERLYSLYNQRNKVVHQYIITDIKTNDMLKIAYDYEIMCEEIRLVLSNIESEQFNKKIGYHGTKDPHRERDKNYSDLVFSMVNDKHFVKEFYRRV